MTSPALTAEPIAWAGTGDGEFPYRAWHSGSHLRLRVNDFPAEPLYTLFVDDRPLLDLEDWPTPWLRPAPTAGQLRIAGTEQLRRGRVDAIVIADWAHRLCVAPAGPAAEVLAALGLPADQLSLGARLELGEEAGVVTTVRLSPTGGGPSRAELTALLGPAIEGDPAGPARFYVWPSGVPFSCEVTAGNDAADLRRHPIGSAQARRGR